MSHPATTPPDPVPDPLPVAVPERKLLAVPGALDVLRAAAGSGYVLVGPHNRICRRDPTSYGTRRPDHVVDIARTEQDHVQALAVTGLLHLDGREVVVDQNEERAGYPLRLTRTGAIALNSWNQQARHNRQDRP